MLCVGLMLFRPTHSMHSWLILYFCLNCRTSMHSHQNIAHSSIHIAVTHNDLVKQLPVCTKVGLFLVLDLSLQAKNVLESSTETFINIANAFVLTRLLVRWEAWPSFRFQTKHISWCFCQARPHYYQQSLRSMISTERILAFGFQWLDSVTRLLPPNSRKWALRCFQSFGKCAWIGEHHGFRIMVWDVVHIIYLHPTTDKEKVLLSHRNNREEITTSTQSSLPVQRASVACMTPTVNSSDFVILSFFFFFLVFSQKLRRRVTRNIEKKHMALQS